MNLYWGVEPIHVEASELDAADALSRRLVRELDLADPGEYVLRVAGFSHEPEKNVPRISVLTV
jgi:pyruvate kinase